MSGTGSKAAPSQFFQDIDDYMKQECNKHGIDIEVARVAYNEKRFISIGDFHMWLQDQQAAKRAAKCQR